MSTDIRKSTLDVVVAPKLCIYNGKTTAKIEINCSGATSEVGFSTMSGNWDVEVDGVYHRHNNEDPYNLIMKYYSDKVTVTGDGSLYINNDSPNSIKFRMIPDKTSGVDYVIEGDSRNKSIQELPNGDLIFCLSEAQA